MRENFKLIFFILNRYKFRKIIKTYAVIFGVNDFFFARNAVTKDINLK
jgi:hypothetical protein